jgi:hypothetical protein
LCHNRHIEDPPQLVEAEVRELPTSQLVLTGDVAEAQVLSAVTAQIPSTLAHEKDRAIGTPGRVTYTVTRGAIDSSLRDGTFHVTTLANASIEVCKPLGPFCVTYGRCQPVLATTVSLPLALNGDYSYKPLTTSLRAERGCQIAGFDVTPRLTSLARSNLDTIEKRIERSLPPIRPWAERLWELTRNPLFLDAKHCLRVTPKRFVQAPAKETPRGFELGVGVDLSVELTRDCERRESPPLAPLATETKLAAGPVLRLAQLVDSESASRQLTESVKGVFGDGEQIHSVVVHTAKIDNQNRVVLETKLNGLTCGNTWLKATLAPTPGGSLGLSDVAGLDGDLTDELRELPSKLEERGRVTAEFPFADVATRLNQLLESAAALGGERLALTAAIGTPKLIAPNITREGIVVIAELSTVAHVTFREMSP